MVQIEKINPDITLGILDLEAFNLAAPTLLKRNLERNGIRFLLDQLFNGQAPVLDYTASKKPFLINSNIHISISHSHEKLAIILNLKHSTGVDVELIRDKVLNIQHKFLSDKEIEFAANDVEKLTELWAAKEAIFKAYGIRDVSFKDHIFIEPYSHKNNFYGELDLPNFKKKYLLHREKTGNYILAYILSEV